MRNALIHLTLFNHSEKGQPPLCMMFILAVLLSCPFQSCRFADEIIHMTPPEVLSWKPGTDMADASSLSSVKLVFSASMDRNLSEQAFSLTEEGEEMEGVFIWKDESCLNFTPRTGFLSHRRYEIRLGNTAEDRWGNSMNHEWCVRFRTGNDMEAPEIISVSPEEYTLIENPRQTVIFSFSEAVNKQSFRNALSIRPDLFCAQDWGEDSKSVNLIPLEDYRRGEEYSFTLGTALTDLAGHSLRESCVWTFPVSDPGDAQLVELNTLTEGRALSPSSLNDKLEKETSLKGRMNRPLRSGERTSLLSLSPDRGFETEWSASGDEFTLRFNEPPAWQSSMTLTIGGEEFLLLFDGAGSRPPEVLSLHFCADAENPAVDEPRMISLNGPLGAADSKNAFLDIRLLLAEGASLNQSSLLESLSITSPVLTVTGTGCTGYSAAMVPAPAVVPVQGECLYRLNMEVETTGLPGTVVITLDGSLHDNRDNSMTESYTRTVSQP